MAVNTVLSEISKLRGNTMFIHSKTHKKESKAKTILWYLKVKVKSLSLTLCNPVDCSLPGSSLYGILQARILE